MPLENKENIIIHQAYYGEVSRSHGCIASSINDEQVNSFLTGFSDKPYPIPVGITLDTYYAATVFKNFFIVTKTIPNLTASRPGMVFTHALLVNLKDTEQIADLSEVFSHFVTEIPVIKSGLSQCTYEGRVENKKPNTTNYPAYLQQAVGILIQGNKVAFFGSVDNFIKTLFIIWEGLPGPLKKYLTFSIGFSLDDITNKKEPFLFFQSQLNSRITYSGSVNDDDNTMVEIENNVEKLVLGHQNANEFNDFLNLLNCNLQDFKQLANAEKAYQLYTRLEELLADDLRQLIRLIALLSPSPTDGITLKKSVIARLGQFIDGGQDYKVKALRNIQLNGFANAEIELSEKIAGFVVNQFTNKLQFDPIVINEMVVIATEESTTGWWNIAVNKGLTASLGKSEVFGNIWTLLKNPGTDIAKFFPLIPSGQKEENALIEHFPNGLTPANAEALKSFFKTRKWYTIYAHTSLATEEALEAFKEQLTLETNLIFEKSVGVLLIAKKLPDNVLLDFNLKGTDEKAMSLLTDRMVKNHGLIKELDLNNSRWLGIWNSFLLATGNFELGINDIQAKASQLYRLIINKTTIPEKIISLYSLSSFADLSAYSNRDAFWSLVPPAYQTMFLSATADGYAKQIAQKLLFPMVLPEAELQKTMSGDLFVSGYLSTYRSDMEAAVTYYELFTNLKDKFLADYINYFYGDITDIISARLGSIVSSRQYRQTASAIFNKAKNNRTFRIALNKFKSLLSLSIFDRLLYGSLFGETLDEGMAYQALFELVKDLYKSGPEEESIWERAGGYNSKLINQNSREENWRRALHLVRHGGGGKNLSIKSLLKEIQKDFSDNPILIELQQYFKNKQ